MDFPNELFAARRLLRTLQPLLICALVLAGVGCAASSQQEQAGAGEAAVIEVPAGDAAVSEPPPVADSSTPPPQQAPPMSDPLPPVQVPESGSGSGDAPGQVPAGAPVQIDTRCTRDADCVVKNVGNCCGYYPACVNVNSPTDPAAVQAQCAREGTMSICGFPSINGCQCVAGECQAETTAVDR